MSVVTEWTQLDPVKLQIGDTLFREEVVHTLWKLNGEHYRGIYFHNSLRYFVFHVESKNRNVNRLWFCISIDTINDLYNAYAHDDLILEKLKPYHAITYSQYHSTCINNANLAISQLPEPSLDKLMAKNKDLDSEIDEL